MINFSSYYLVQDALAGASWSLLDHWHGSLHAPLPIDERDGQPPAPPSKAPYSPSRRWWDG